MTVRVYHLLTIFQYQANLPRLQPLPATQTDLFVSCERSHGRDRNPLSRLPGCIFLLGRLFEHSW